MDEERKLVEKARNGDGQAFGGLYDRYQLKIYRFIFLKVSKKPEAEDLTQQVFLNAWENISDYEFRGFPFSSWLYRIANNAVIDYYRSGRNYQSFDELSDERAMDFPDWAKELDRDFDFQLVKNSLSRLDSDYQSVLIMKFIEDLSNKEIAIVLGKSEGAIRVIQHRALKQLKKYVDESANNSTTEKI